MAVVATCLGMVTQILHTLPLSSSDLVASNVISLLLTTLPPSAIENKKICRN